MEFATYVGGSGIDLVADLVVADDGSLLLTGLTSSVNFPVEDALDGTLSGVQDAFVAKMDPTGRRLIFATYLGGSSSDDGRKIDLGSDGEIYVGGGTSSTDFPAVSAFQNSFGGTADGFVARLDPTGSVLELATYLGGSGGDGLGGLSVDGTGGIYVSGLVQSSDFPTTNGVFQPTYGGSGDVFVAKIGNAGNLEYASYLGGSDFDTGGQNVIDSEGNLYVVGSTESTDFPVLNGLDDTFGGGMRDGFVAKVSHVPLTTGATLEWSTFLGDMGTDGVSAIDLDPSDDLYVTGFSGSADFPVDDDLDPTLGGDVDAFATKLDSTGTSILYSTFLGGSGSDSGTDLVVDRFGKAHVTGNTTSTDFPVVEAVQPTFGAPRTPSSST